MRIAELARRSGLTTSTVKWYLRIGLVHPGRLTAKTQAQYDESHVHRLLLVRALIDVGGISTESARSILNAVDDPQTTPMELVKTAHAAVSAHTQPPSGGFLNQADAFIAERDWKVEADSRSRVELAHVMAGLNSVIAGPPDQPALDKEVFESILSPYASAAEDLARAELSGLAQLKDRTEMVVRVVAGTVLLDRALTALHRLAQEHFAHLMLTSGNDSRDDESQREADPDSVPARSLAARRTGRGKVRAPARRASQQ